MLTGENRYDVVQQGTYYLRPYAQCPHLETRIWDRPIIVPYWMLLNFICTSTDSNSFFFFSFFFPEPRTLVSVLITLIVWPLTLTKDFFFFFFFKKKVILLHFWKILLRRVAQPKKLPRIIGHETRDNFNSHPIKLGCSNFS
jgi:hypothetical protein